MNEGACVLPLVILGMIDASITLLEQEAEVMRRAVGYLSRDANPKLCTRWSSTLPMTAFPSR